MPSLNSVNFVSCNCPSGLNNASRWMQPRGVHICFLFLASLLFVVSLPLSLSLSLSLPVKLSGERLRFHLLQPHHLPVISDLAFPASFSILWSTRSITSSLAEFSLSFSFSLLRAVTRTPQWSGLSQWPLLPVRKYQLSCQLITLSRPDVCKWFFK